MILGISKLELSLSDADVLIMLIAEKRKQYENYPNGTIHFDLELSKLSALSDRIAKFIANTEAN